MVFPIDMPIDQPASPPPVRPARAWRFWVQKVVSLVVLGILLGWVYDYSVPRLYQPQVPAGFFHGVVHGALMPVALPDLLMGHDVPIFSGNNSGRWYKIGYIAGINLCGLLFFGLAFRSPRGRQAA